MKFKMTTVRLSKLKLIGSPNIVPNEGSIQLYRDFETEKFTWVDPGNLINGNEKDFIENQLGKEGANKANAIFERYASCTGKYCGYYQGDAKLFIKKLLSHMSSIVDVEKTFDHVYCDGCFKNALGVAVFFDAAEAVENILNRGVDINFPSKWFLPCSPLQAAICQGSTQVFSKLLEKGANTDFEKPHDIVLSIIGNAKLLAILLDQRPSLDLNSRYWYFDCRGYTLLHEAVHSNSVESVELLIKAGADLNIPENEHGWTPLFCSAYYGYPEITSLLIEAGANLFWIDQKGNKTLKIPKPSCKHSEHESGRSKCVKFIREAQNENHLFVKHPNLVGAKVLNHIGTMVKN